MEKALDILKDVLINMDFLDDDGYHFGKYATMEAIAELEEAMKPKTCYWCKHYEEKQCTNENSIAFGGINAVYEDDFCNDFEPKDNA